MLVDWLLSKNFKFLKFKIVGESARDLLLLPLQCAQGNSMQ